MRIVNLQTGLLLLTDWERATRSYWQEKELLEHTPIAYYGSSSLKVPDYPIHSNLAPGAAEVPVGYGPEPVYNAAFPAFEPPQGNSYPAHRPPSTFNTVGPLNSSLHYNNNSFNRLGPSYATSIPDWDDPSTTQTHAKMLGGPETLKAWPRPRRTVSVRVVTSAQEAPRPVRPSRSTPMRTIG